MSHRSRPPTPTFATRAPVVPGGSDSTVHPTGTVTQTVDHEVDARTALMRGMCEYLRTLSVLEPGGKVVKFATVVEGQSEPEASAAYPWCCVMAPEEAPYRGGMAPRPKSEDRISAPDRGGQEVYAVATSSFDTTLHLVFWCEKGDRTALMRMLEADLQCPDQLRQRQYGVTVELPFYMGRRANYAPVSSQYVDSSGDARQARFGGVMKVSASISVARIVERPRARPLLSTSVR